MSLNLKLCRSYAVTLFVSAIWGSIDLLYGHIDRFVWKITFVPIFCTHLLLLQELSYQSTLQDPVLQTSALQLKQKLISIYLWQIPAGVVLAYFYELQHGNIEGFFLTLTGGLAIGAQLFIFSCKSIPENQVPFEFKR